MDGEGTLLGLMMLKKGVKMRTANNEKGNQPIIPIFFLLPEHVDCRLLTMAKVASTE